VRIGRADAELDRTTWRSLVSEADSKKRAGQSPARELDRNSKNSQPAIATRSSRTIGAAAVSAGGPASQADAMRLASSFQLSVGVS
jgi:hypothetical protein